MAQRHCVNDAGVKPLRADGNLFLIYSAWEEQGGHVERALLALARRHSITCRVDRRRLVLGLLGLIVRKWVQRGGRLRTCYGISRITLSQIQRGGSRFEIRGTLGTKKASRVLHTGGDEVPSEPGSGQADCEHDARPIRLG